MFVVLSDPQTRAIYDIYGKRGLDVDGWEVSQLVTVVADKSQVRHHMQSENNNLCVDCQSTIY